MTNPAAGNWNELKSVKPSKSGFYLVYSNDKQIGVAFWGDSKFTGSIGPYVTHWAQAYDLDGNIYI